MSLIDFSPLKEDYTTIDTFAEQFTVEDLRSASNAYVDTLLELVQDLTDEQIIFIPEDPEADDPHAPEEEQHIAWSVAHLILHTTASMEEGAAFASLLARGVELPPEVRIRLRYEPDWKTITTTAEIIHRLEESRRMRLGYLDTFPDEPHLDNFRPTKPDSPMKNKVNAIGAFLFSLSHEHGHLDQIKDARRQALAAYPA